MARKICVVTGTRAEYGILKPVMDAIKKSPTLELSVIVTGMHLAQQFGYTLREIEEDGFRIDAKVDMLLSGDTGTAMAKSIGNGIISIAQALDIIKPDIILILGDRTEPFAAAIAGAYMNIPIAHIHGGDSAKAGLDEYARHAITKLSHIHFPATEKSAERIIKMGEDPSNVFVVGAPGLDSILNEKLVEPTELPEKYNLELSEPILLVVQHPVTTEVDDAPEQIRETLEAIIDLKHQTILIYPNADAGGRRMVGAIKKYEKYPFIKTFKSIPHKEYLSLMKIASVLIGNSSSGIIEAPSFGLPVVNIGSRQEGRQRAENVIDVGYDKEKIISAIKEALHDKDFKEKVKKCKNPYGDGKAGVRIADILSKIKIDEILLQKKIIY
jgi:GDP/UDP-N,N'-diacetylbacillosamine 2-epimerase (hydrolysing)